MNNQNIDRTLELFPVPPSASLLQNQLQEIITIGWNIPFYRNHWGYSQLDVLLDDIKSGGFDQLPIIRKQDLRDNWDDIMHFDSAVDVVSSSGTTGRPVDIPIHQVDEQIRTLRVRRLLHELGVRTGERVLQLLSLNDLFTLGPIAWQAIKALDGCAIRCSSQRLERVLQIIKYHQPKFVIGNPFVLVRMAQMAGSQWPSPDQLPNRAFLAVAATFDVDLNPTPIAQAVKELWGLEECINQYGTSELGPIAHECRHHQGLHIHADHHLVELIDPETGQTITDPDQPGEVVLTGLTVPRGFLPIRYATGDISGWLRTDPCPCGRSTPRLGPILGRVDHQLKVLGQTVYPDLLLSVTDKHPFVQRSAVRVRRDKYGSDEVSLLVVAASDHDPVAVQSEIASKVSQNLAVSPLVEVVTEAHLVHLENTVSKHTNGVKVPRFFDMREEDAV